MSQSPKPLTIPDAAKEQLKVLFIAKHALSAGELDREDGNHAIYHHETLQTLKDIGLNLTLANDPSALFGGNDYDYVFSLLNRAGYQNSEMTIPLLCKMKGIACLGASPILRGIGDDKFVMSQLAMNTGVPTLPSLVIRQGRSPDFAIEFPFERLIVKPNASSASWGIAVCDTVEQARSHAGKLLNEGHDVIIERYFGDYDIVVPVVGAREPIILPTCRFIIPHSENQFRSYEEKRGLAGGSKEVLVRVEDSWIVEQVEALTVKLLDLVYPFDYGRFEFRYDEKSGELRFMEVNLSCNLWSKKTVSGAAQMIGWNHKQLIEHIIAHSMERQGLIKAES